MWGVPLVHPINFGRRYIMPWYLNKGTGIKWEVTDEELLKRLCKDGNYEIIEEKQEKKAAPEKSKETTKK